MTPTTSSTTDNTSH